MLSWKHENGQHPWTVPKTKRQKIVKPTQEVQDTPWSIEHLEIPDPTPEDIGISKEAVRLLHEISAQKRKTSMEVEEILNPPEPDHKTRASNYTSVEVNGLYGLIEQGDATDKDRDMIAHMPRWVKGHSLDIKPGDIIEVASVDSDNKKRKNLLLVTYTTPNKYYAPGARVSTLKLGVREYTREE